MEELTTAVFSTESPEQAKCFRFIVLTETFFLEYCLVPSVIITIIFCFLKSRRKFRVDKFYGRPSLPWPVNFLEEQENRLSYIAAFSLLTCAFWHSMFKGEILDLNVPPELKSLYKLFTCSLIAITCYPVFATITLNHIVSYIVGLLYTVFIALVYISDLFPCNYTITGEFVIQFMRPLPVVISSSYLCVNFFYNILKLLKQKKFYFDTLAIWFVDFYYTFTFALKLWIKDVSSGIQNELNLHNITITASNDTMTPVIHEIEFWIDVIGSTLFLSLICAFLSTTISILFTLKSYRQDTFNLYRGNYSSLLNLKSRAANSIILKATKYVGYQYSYALWGFFVQALVFLVVFLVFVITSILIFRYHIWGILYFLMEELLPTVIYLIFLMLIKNIIINMFFLLKNEKGKRVLAFNNRTWFFNFQYFMLYANAILGFVSALLRIGKAIVFGVWTLPRLDKSTLSRTFETYDSGFSAYVSLVTMEAQHLNPVGNVFAAILFESVSSDQRSREYKLSRNRWNLLITLHNNPSLLVYRKEKPKNLNGKKIKSNNGLKCTEKILTQFLYVQKL